MVEDDKATEEGTGRWALMPGMFVIQTTHRLLAQRRVEHLMPVAAGGAQVSPTIRSSRDGGLMPYSAAKSRQLSR